jgi:hypothetical protein
MATPTLEEVLFGRPALQFKIFVSSQMRGNRLRLERKAVVEAIEATSFATAWHWERDSKAGPYCAEKICVGHAETSDGLVLILASRLTDVTAAEYRAAKAKGVPRYIFLRDGTRREPRARDFVARERTHAAVTRNFANDSELRTQVTEAVIAHTIYSARSDVHRRHIAHKASGRKRRM